MTDTGDVTPPAEKAGGDEGAKPWYDGADAETIGYLQNRGLDKKDAKEVALASIKAHREAVSKLGVPPDQIVRLPKDANDVEGQKALYARLGKPDSPDKYDLKAAEDGGASAEFVDFLRKTSDKLNLTADQARELAKDFIVYADGSTKGEEANETAALEQERADLRKEWGPNFNANLTIARMAAQKVGIPPEAVAAIEEAAGYKVVMTALQKIGMAIGEARFVTSETTGNVMTREGAIARKAELMKDTEWTTKYLNGDANKVREMTDLNRIITAGM